MREPDEIHPGLDLIDSRDVIARIEWLEAEVEEEENTLTDDERDELLMLKDLAKEAQHSPDWLHGETLIRDSYFATYAEELAEDIGAISGDAQWPLYCIDWERAARDLQQDYMNVEFDGTTYWIRA